MAFLSKRKTIEQQYEVESSFDAMVAECGDVLWYLTRLIDELGYSVSEVAQANVDKLLDRKERGVIGGSGDNR